jgi:hypothetical protein
MTRRMGFWMLAAALCALLPCDAALAQSATTAEKKDLDKKTADAWESLKNYTHAKKNDAVAYGSKLMKQTDTQIKQLQAKASKASGDAKAEYNRQIAALKDKQFDAGKKLREMRDATAASWDAAKDGFADAYKDLRDTYKRLRESSDRAATYSK